MTESLNIFRGTTDRYNGVTIDSMEEPCEDSDFLDKLSESLKQWNLEERRCIWFKVYIDNATWVPILAKNGFSFHHARDGFVMMYKWLPTNTSANLPPSSHTNLGVGAIVFNEEDQILVVTEQHFEYPHWKLPGGYVERGEDIKDAAVREVKEETGVDAVFESMVTIRHTHKAMFDNSDVYVVVTLKATSVVIEKAEIEIKDCKWMDIEEYLNHPHVYEFNRFLVRQAMDCKNRRIKLNLNKETVKVANWSRETTALVIEDL